jgi:hypothetical protein
MQLLGRTVMQELIVKENVQDHILGIDFINRHVQGYSMAKLECFWELPPIERGHLMGIQHTYIRVYSS